MQTTYLVRVAMQDPQECERVQNGAGVGAKNTNSNVNQETNNNIKRIPRIFKSNRVYEVTIFLLIAHQKLRSGTVL